MFALLCYLNSLSRIEVNIYLGSVLPQGSDQDSVNLSPDPDSVNLRPDPDSVNLNPDPQPLPIVS